MLLDTILTPLDFKRKGNNWIKEVEEITKKVNLQRSQFSDDYYINYGYILHSIPLEGLLLHIYMRCETTKVDIGNMAIEMETINTEQDILDYLLTLPTLNVVPLVIKKHFNLPIE